MTAQVHRYNAGIQRVKAFLEIASALYDGSLSTETTRATLGTVQTETRLGTNLTLSLRMLPERLPRAVDLTFATGPMQVLNDVAEHRVSMHCVNPSVALTMAVRGTGPFTRALALRHLAVFPSYDIIGFAVRGSTGVTSLGQIAEERIPLRLSTRQLARHPVPNDATMFTVGTVLEGAGFTLADMREWGGQIHEVPWPSHPERRAGIEDGTIDAVFDEGIKAWAQAAVDAGFRFLPIEGAVLKKMTGLGYRPTLMRASSYKGLPQDVPTIDFSGWPMVVHAEMPDEVAYALVEAIEARKEAIPTDNFRPLDVAQLCANDEEAPYDVPLHPGAERFYREKGYLR